MSVTSGATVKSVNCHRFTCSQGGWFASLLEPAASSKVTAAPSKFLLCLLNYIIFYPLFRKELLHFGSRASQGNHTSIMDKSQDKKHRGFLFLTVNSGSYANLNSEEHLAFVNATMVLVEEFLRCEKPQSNNNFLL